MTQKLSLCLIVVTTLIVLVCYVIPSAVSQQCSYQAGIDIFGNDLALQYASTIQQCCNACFNDANCQAWTYVPDTQACWIKSAVGSIRQAVSQRYSGLKNGQLTSLLTSQGPAQSANFNSAFLVFNLLTNIILIQALFFF